MNLNKYFKNERKFKNKIVVISAKDEASKYIWSFGARHKLHLDIDVDFRGSYVAVVDKKRKFIYEESSKKMINCSYKVSDNHYIDIISAGFDAGNKSSIKANNKEYSLNKTGLNIAIFNYKTLKLIDSFNVNTYVGTALKINRK